MAYLGLHRLARNRVLKTRAQEEIMAGDEPAIDRKHVSCQKILVRRIIRHEEYNAVHVSVWHVRSVACVVCGT